MTPNFWLDPYHVSTEHYLRFRPLKWLLPGVYREVTRRCALTTYQQVLSHYASEFLFDLRYGVDTARIVPKDRLNFADAERQKHSSRYRATPPKVIEAGLRCLLAHCPEARDFPLVDYGCGAGRVLVCAAFMGFRNIVGLELSPHLLKLARRNRERVMNMVLAPSLTVLDTDACSYELDAETRACYLFDPFKGPVLDAVLDQIGHSLLRNSRPFYLVTHYMDDALLRGRGFVRVDQRWGASLYAAR